MLSISHLWRLFVSKRETIKFYNYIYIYTKKTKKQIKQNNTLESFDGTKSTVLKLLYPMRIHQGNTYKSFISFP